MYKTVGIYRNIADSKQFEKYYIENVMPLMLAIPGVIKMKITNIGHNMREQATTFDGVQFIIETHFESLEDLRKIAGTSKGREIIKKILGNNGELGSYIGKTKTFIAKMKK